MRAKTDEKRQAIIEAATAVFEAVGYQRASMAMISARLGGSKATLYSYFQSKEQLFATAMTLALHDAGSEMLSELESGDDIATILSRYGLKYLAFVTQPEILSIQRTVLTDSRATGLGREIYELGPQRSVAALSTLFEQRHASGEIDLPSPEIGALHFKGLVEAGVTEPMLYGSERVRDPREAVADAVAAFMKIYGLVRQPAGRDGDAAETTGAAGGTA